MAIAKYRFDAFGSTLTISKAFEKNASNIGSAEQKVLGELMEKYGDALIIERYKSHKVKKGLTFAQMENHINHSTNNQKMLEQFVKVKELSKSQKNPYKYVLKWFKDHYPNNAEQPEFDEDGLAKVKAAAPTTESTEETEAAPAENTVEKSAEAPTANTEISRLPEAAEEAAQTEKPAA